MKRCVLSQNLKVLGSLEDLTRQEKREFQSFWLVRETTYNICRGIFEGYLGIALLESNSGQN